MNDKKKSGIGQKIAMAAVIVFIIVCGFIVDKDTVQQSAWALVPPIIAIALALITKEVYSSLFIGILTGALFYSGYSFEGTLMHIFSDTVVAADGTETTYGIISVLSDSYNVGILVFLVVLGAIVQLMNRTGGSAAFGNWASSRIKSRKAAECTTVLLGVLIFIDDYFNCLTVGSVMRPVTDKHHVSRAKLAYLIDATAAPVCIIAPISSWAAAVSGFVEGQNGISLFIKTIPYNFYALFTIFMMFLMIFLGLEYGPMKTHELNALKGDLYTTEDRPYADAEKKRLRTDGHVIDMLFPIAVLIICCVIGMIYSGGFFSGESFIDAFANSDASIGLVLGSASAIIITIVFYLIRGSLSFKDCMDCLPQGFMAMVPAILILTFAWSLKSMTDSLGAKEFVAGVIAGSAGSFVSFLPFIIFLIAVFLSFATGTSWGTFGILIPIVVAIFESTDPTMMVLSMSACMAGSVCGDHCSPISDTTIMSSAGAQCNHLNHVSTQMPYALTCAVVSAVTYIVAGLTKSAVISLIVGAALMVITVFVLRAKFGMLQEQE
ncbi:MAG: Na+/H+ antiporter NhaC family protein [Lachnospiraceae bacterium]|nr:Na+/H+ antiporter NhaC family protein [Lachnospiraceae bacterium]